MKTFKQFLLEDSDSFLTKSQLRILKSCTQFISSTKGLPCYRGFMLTNNIGETVEFMTKPISTKRPPRDMSQYNTDFFNLGIEVLTGEKMIRSRGSFCTADVNTSLAYGDPYFVIYPNGYNILYSTKVKDAISVKIDQFLRALDGTELEKRLFRFSPPGLKIERSDFVMTFPNTLESFEKWHLLENADRGTKDALLEALKNFFKKNGFKKTTGFLGALRNEKEILVYDVPEVHMVGTDKAVAFYKEKFSDKFSGSFSNQVKTAYEFLMEDIKNA